VAYFDQAYSGKVTAAGTLTIKIRPTGRQTWTVRQVSTSMTTAPTGAACFVKKNGNPISPLVATGDVADGEPPIRIAAVDTMTVEWSGCTSGDTGTVLIVGDDGTRG
jgi:hypothetical protein